MKRQDKPVKLALLAWDLFGDSLVDDEHWKRYVETVKALNVADHRENYVDDINEFMKIND